MTIFLIGYMASGKTTLGRALARRLGRDFIDLDFYITQRFRKSVSQIFAEEGEERFREIERNMLREVGEFSDVIVSCGGGTPCFFDNVDYMNSAGLTICLRATTACTVHRLLTAKTRRPIVEGKSEEELPQFIEKHIATRLPYYRKARHLINSDNLETSQGIEAAVDEVCRLAGIPAETPQKESQKERQRGSKNH